MFLTACSNWWTAEDLTKFKSRAQCVSSVYHSYVMDGLHIRGNDTLGEDIADIGGVHSAWLAYLHESHQQRGRAPTPLEKRVFMVSAGQAWCGLSRKAALDLQIRTDEHAPDAVRVNAGLSQLPAFAHAFECPVNAPLNPKSRCDLW